MGEGAGMVESVGVGLNEGMGVDVGVDVRGLASFT